jgi:hypothetical protein
MKVISIIQPWATLIMLGEKRYETKSRRTHYRGELGIHASKKVNKGICELEPFKSVLAKHGYTADNLPTGAILGRVILRDCQEVVYDRGDYAILGVSTRTAAGNEYAFGDYTEGRFVYDLSDIDQFDKPIPTKGQLGLWNYQEGDPRITKRPYDVPYVENGLMGEQRDEVIKFLLDNETK